MATLLGCLGYCESNQKKLEKMLSSITIPVRQSFGKTHFGRNFAATQISLNPHTQNHSYFDEYQGLYLWVDGEVYSNTHTNKYSIHQNDSNFATEFLDSYSASNLSEFLSKIDGYFVAVLYNSHKHEIVIATDRYGMQLLYLSIENGCLYWASEVKSILSIRANSSFDNDLIPFFIEIGHLPATKTWFKEIELAPPASIITFNLQEQRAKYFQYWGFGNITPNKISFEDAVIYGGELLQQAISKRFSTNERIGIPLSGGLDSRVIVSGIMKEHPTYRGSAFSFGPKNCTDVRIAQEVTRLSKWDHRLYSLGIDDWLEKRIEQIWATDGQFDIAHMHSVECAREESDMIDVAISGYLGDIILGGGWLNSTGLNNRASPNSVKLYRQGSR